MKYEYLPLEPIKVNVISYYYYATKWSCCFHCLFGPFGLALNANQNTCLQKNNWLRLTYHSLDSFGPLHFCIMTLYWLYRSVHIIIVCTTKSVIAPTLSLLHTMEHKILVCLQQRPLPSCAPVSTLPAHCLGSIRHACKAAWAEQGSIKMSHIPIVHAHPMQSPPSTVRPTFCLWQVPSSR